MAIETLVPLRPKVVASLPGGAAKGDTVVLVADGHLYTFDGSGWVDNGAGGGSGLSDYQVRRRALIFGG